MKTKNKGMELTQYHKLPSNGCMYMKYNKGKLKTVWFPTQKQATEEFNKEVTVFSGIIVLGPDTENPIDIRPQMEWKQVNNYHIAYFDKEIFMGSPSTDDEVAAIHDNLEVALSCLSGLQQSLPYTSQIPREVEVKAHKRLETTMTMTIAMNQICRALFGNKKIIIDF
jgi:hypothetical protein